MVLRELNALDDAIQTLGLVFFDARSFTSFTCNPRDIILGNLSQLSGQEIVDQIYHYTEVLSETLRQRYDREVDINQLTLF